MRYDCDRTEREEFWDSSPGGYGCGNGYGGYNHPKGSGAGWDANRQGEGWGHGDLYSPQNHDPDRLPMETGFGCGEGFGDEWET